MEPLPPVPASDHSWYFAYGSNLSTERIKRRTGLVALARPSRLQNYRLTFNLWVNDECFANVVPCVEGIVWGVAYWLSREAMNVLDGYEGVAVGHYRRAAVEVETETGERLQAEIYLGGERFAGKEGLPSGAYLQWILTGAREHRLPEPYVQSVQARGKTASS